MKKKSILEIYALAVCFATIACFTISLGIGLYSFIRVVNPEFTMNSYDYKRHLSNDKFWEAKASANKESERPSEAELTKKRKAGLEFMMKVERRDGWQSLFQIFIILIITVITFIVHWRIAKRAREDYIHN